jgi:hypothetical protein
MEIKLNIFLDEQNLLTGVSKGFYFSLSSPKIEGPKTEIFETHNDWPSKNMFEFFLSILRTLPHKPEISL